MILLNFHSFYEVEGYPQIRLTDEAAEVPQGLNLIPNASLLSCSGIGKWNGQKWGECVSECFCSLHI